MNKKILIGVGVFIIIIIIGILMYYTTDQKQEENEIYINNYLNDLGYTYNEEEKMFKKITTNNTLDEFYELSSKNQEAYYEEYYFSLDNNSFIELNMAYKDGITEVFNVTSDLTKQEITYNYEITKDDSSAILEGSYNNNSFKCEIVSLKKLNDDNKDQYCETIRKYANKFIEEENQLLNNEEFNNIINIPKKEVVLK